MTKQFTDMGRGVRELKLQELHAAYERQHGPLPISPFQGGKEFRRMSRVAREMHLSTLRSAMGARVLEGIAYGH